MPARPGRVAARRTPALVAAAVTCAVGLTLVPSSGSTATPGDGPPRGARAQAATSSEGAWEVARTGRDTYRVTWRAPHRLPVTSDRATIVSGGVPIGVPVLRADGRTVVTTVISEERPVPAELDVLLSGDRLDHPGLDQSPASAAPVEPLASAPLAVDPAEKGPHDVVTSDYELAPVKLRRMPEPIEMVGHVVEPAPAAATGPRPLVLFLHGRHSVCYDPSGDDLHDFRWPCRPPLEEIPSHLGYDYIQRVLASQGFTTVSVRANGINAQDFRLDDGGADARARLVQEHLHHWATIAGAHQVDLSQVVLVGHSRGGEGVNRASIQIPLDADYRVVGQVLLAPTDFGTQTAPYVPTVTVLPYCDGDVFDLQGQRFTDSARDLAADDTSLKSSVLALGANHNFFNTEWTPGIAQAPSFDDWFGRRGVCGKDSPTRLRPKQQRQVGVAYVAGAVNLFADEAGEFLPLYDGSAVHPPSIGDADVRSHAIGGGRELRRPAIDTGLSLPAGAETSFCRGVVAPESMGACGRDFDLFGQAPHWYFGGEFAPSRRAFEMSWTAPGQTGGLVFDEPLDLSSGRLELRTIVDPTLGNVRLRLRLTDDAGDSAEVTPEGAGLVRALPLDRQVGKRWAQPVLADPSTATGIDLTRVARLDVIGDTPDGRLWLLDVAAAPDSLAAVPEKRMATVSLGSLRVDEGDRRGTSVAQLPFTVDGDLSRPAQLVVGILDETQRRGRSRLRLDLAPGQTAGSIRYEYQGNRVDDFRRRSTFYAAYAVEGVMTDKYNGRVDLLDDDPAPRVRVTVSDRVSEGERIEIRVRLSRAAGYPFFVSARAVRGKAPGTTRLAVGDLPPAWLRSHFLDAGNPSLPLHRAGLGLFDDIRPGGRRLDFTIPVRDDGVREGVEHLVLRIDTNEGKVKRTVRVRD